MRKSILAFLVLSSFWCLSASYQPQKSSVWAEDIHYDANLNMIVVHAHADFLFFSINKIYGIQVKDNANASAIVDRMIGPSPKISELRMSK